MLKNNKMIIQFFKIEQIYSKHFVKKESGIFMTCQLSHEHEIVFFLLHEHGYGYLTHS